jgi:hypothetical protein
MKRQIITSSEFETFTSSLIELALNHIWQGHGSAIFLEFGPLTQRQRRDGSVGNPTGEWTLAIEGSWRVEGKRLIWCGSWSDADRWPRAFARLLNAKAASISLTGRLPEIDLKLSNGLHVVSFMPAEGDPQWGLINHSKSANSIGVSAGRLIFEARESKAALS